MTQHTADRIDAEHQANHNPDDCSTRAISTALEGRCLFDRVLIEDIDPVCRRCEEKNEKRRMAGVETTNPQLEDGDRVVFHAVHVDDDDRQRPPHWNIRPLSHAEHPQVDFDDAIASGTAFIRARGTIHETPTDQYIVDVEVMHRSRTDAGPDQSIIEQRRQQFVDDSDAHPADMTVIDRDPGDAPAHWPELDRQWLSDLEAKHGPLEMQTYSVSVSPDIDADPRGRDGE